MRPNSSAVLKACFFTAQHGKMQTFPRFNGEQREILRVEREGFPPMTSIERTAYPRFRRTPSTKELRDFYTPTLADKDFVNKTARGPAQKFGLMILFKVYQRLGYFPKPETIPGGYYWSYSHGHEIR